MQKNSEILAAISIIFPSLCCLFFIKFDEKFDKNFSKLNLVCFSIFFHAPWSFLLHLYRAFGNDSSIRTFLYKMDVKFHHIY